MNDKSYKRLIEHTRISPDKKRIISGVEAKINHHKILALKIRFGAYALCLLGILFVTKPIMTYVTTGLYQSGFADYLTVAFTTSESALFMSRDFFWTLIESLPVLEITIVSTIILLFVYSLRHTYLAFVEFADYSRKKVSVVSRTETRLNIH